jgi:LemA protein
MSSGWIVLGIIVIIVLFAVGAYNRLVALRQRVDQACRHRRAAQAAP